MPMLPLPARAGGALACVLLGACAPLAAGRAPLVTDRPGFTGSTPALERGTVQVEAGTTVIRADEVRAVSAGEVLVRAGVARRVEARVGVPSYGHVSVASYRATGMEDASLGAKVVLLEPSVRPSPLRPAVSLIVGTTLPTGARVFRGDGMQPEARLLLGWQAAERVSVGVNASYARLSDGDLRYGELSGSATVGVAVRERLGVFAEAYGFAPRARDGSAYLNAGTTWLLTPDLQLDARIGVGVHHAPGERILGLGFARRF